MSDNENNIPAVDEKEDNMTVEVNKFAAGDQQGEIESEEEEGKDNEMKEETTEHNGEGEEDSEESPQKGHKRKNEEEDEEESEEESEEETDDEEQVGSLEKPRVVEGKRDRKKTMRYETDTGSSEKNKVKINEGSGTKLQDIPSIDFNISRNKAELLKILHRVAFGRPGRAVFVKKNLRQFSGFTFTKSSEEYQKKASLLASGMTIALLKFMCEVLDIERSGTKDVLIERLLDFLLKPTDSGKPISNKSKRKRSRTSTGEKKRKPKKKKASKKKETKQTPVKKTKKKKIEEDEEAESESEEEPVDSESESEVEEATPEPKRKKPKTESPRKKTPQKAKKERKKSVEKKKTPAKKTPVKRQKKVEKATAEESEDDSDDEPLGVKTKRPPSDDELRDVIKKILEGANLEEVTMKTVCKQVYDKFPDMDLTSRKDFIKATVKQIIR